MAAPVHYRRQVRTARQGRHSPVTKERIPAALRRRTTMNSMNKITKFELEIGIEELEPKVAPDGGETVLPLPKTHHK